MKNKSALLVLFSLYAATLFCQQGLLGEYYNGKNFESLKMTRTDKKLDFYWDNVAPAPGIDANDFSIRWKGQIKAPKTGDYLFKAKVDDGLRVKVNGKLVINAWVLNDHVDVQGKISLKAGELYSLEVEYFNGMFEGEIRLFWQLPGEEPTFGGLFGYNEKLIESQYFFLPPAATPYKDVINTIPSKPVSTTTPAKPVVVSPPKASKKPEPAKSVVLSKDSLEKFIPKNVNFEKGKAILLKDSYGELNLLAQFLLRHTSLKLSVEGHTDNVGDSNKNLILSEERSRTVADYLIAKGIEGTRISTKGYGDTRPLVKQKVNGGYAPNRRVEFILNN